MDQAPRRPHYRVYIDEVGNSDLKASSEPNHRYLSLTGVIVSLEYVQATMFSEVEAFKSRHFPTQHPDAPVVLHRKELLQGVYPFQSLQDPKARKAFDEDLFNLLERLEYTVVTAVIDKLEFLNRYKAWQEDPYHYCLEVVIERYVSWLRSRGAAGDAMAESRGGGDDKRLKRAFTDLYNQGSQYVGASVFQRRLTSRELKLKPKAFNICGLQIADLLAHPSCRAIVERKNNHALPGNFGGKVAALLEESKYRRSGSGTIDGWGRKWLP